MSAVGGVYRVTGIKPGLNEVEPSEGRAERRHYNETLHH
jgi:hypothetical protein